MGAWRWKAAAGIVLVALLVCPVPSLADGEPVVYDLFFHLEVTGQVKLISRTRFYRSEDLHLKLAAVPAPGGWRFHSLGLVAEPGETNFGIGEGPRRHQRYVLVPQLPTPEERRRIEAVVRGIERSRGCCVVEKGSADKPACPGQPKKSAFFNYYAWPDPRGSFRFLLDRSGAFVQVENEAEVEVLERTGGRYARPRFFETLAYALGGVPPYIAPGTQLPDGQVGEVRWEMDLRDLLEGLVRFSNGVYGRKMTLLHRSGQTRQSAEYAAERLRGTAVAAVRTSFSEPLPVPIRVSGFRGELRVESFRRETYLHVPSGRVLRDDIEICFGIRRDKRILSLKGGRNVVKILLVDECLRTCPPTDDDIRVASGRCLGDVSGM